MILVEGVYSPFANSGRNRKPRFSKENSFSLVFPGCMFPNVFDYKEGRCLQYSRLVFLDREKMCQGYFVTRKSFTKLMLYVPEIVDVSPRSDLINFLDITFLSVQPDLSRKCFLYICNQSMFQTKIYYCRL